MPEPLYRHYGCKAGSPLACKYPLTTVEKTPAAIHCSECGFPAVLPKEAQIRGNQGVYQIEQYLGHRGVGRLYRGIRLSDNQPVAIAEYLLPQRTFSPTEAKQRKRAFLNLAGISLADGRLQDMRLVIPHDAIAAFAATDKVAKDHRCYAVSRGVVGLYPNLRQYLSQYGVLSPTLVRHILNQTLQSLDLLHNQKFRLASGQIQVGVAHGNLTLDSVLLAPGRKSQVEWQAPHPAALESEAADAEFFIYLANLSLWEKGFWPPPTSLQAPTIADDLAALGRIGWQLLQGTPDSDDPSLADPEAIAPPEIEEETDEQSSADPPLQAFLWQLMDKGQPFATADEARRALLKLPLLPSDGTAKQAEVEEEAPARRRWLWWLLALILILLGTLLGILLWRFLTARSTEDTGLACCIADVAGVPDGEYSYTADERGTWTYVLQQENLIQRGETLQSILTTLQPKLKLDYAPEPSVLTAIQQVQFKQAAFLITSLEDEYLADILPPGFFNAGFGRETVAYDGLVVFVPYSSAQRRNSLPEQLNGQLSLPKLRRLYTGEIDNWKQLGGPDLPVKLYLPNEEEAIRIFEQRVLQEESDIARFRRLRDTQMTQLRTFDTLRAAIREFEDPKGSIGAIAFGTLSKVIGQCSVYPLALADNGQRAVQPAIQDSGQPLNPTTDLCKDKGSYRPDIRVFQTNEYPLAYPLSVVYLRDNSQPPTGKKFAEMLRTLEGQRLLQETGLVPLQPLPEKRDNP